MKKAYWKNVFREVRGSFSRFIAILTIVALGTGFLAGLMATTPDMRRSVDKFYDDTNMMDLHIVSTLGLTDKDLSAIRAAKGVSFVMPIYHQDAVMSVRGGDSFAARVQSLPDQAETLTDGSYQNRLVLKEGRLPQSADECVVEFKSTVPNNTVKVGDVLTISDENKDATKNDTFTRKSFTVVGLADSAYYFSIDKEPTDIASGTLNYILYTTESAFQLPVYTDAFVMLEEGKACQSFSEEYRTLSDGAVDTLQRVADQREPARYDEILKEAQEKLDEAQKQYDQKKAEAQTQLTDATQQITEGEKQYQQGKEALLEARLQLAEGQVELLSAKLSYEKTRSAAQSQLDRAQTQVDIAQATLQSASQQLQSTGSIVSFVKEMLSEIEDGSWNDLIPEEKKQRFEEWLAKMTARYPELVQKMETLIAPVLEQIDKLDEATRLKIASYIHAEFDSKLAEYQAAVQAYQNGLTQLETAKAQLAAGQAALAAGEQQAEAQFAAAQQKMDDAKAVIAANGGQLTEAATSLSDAQQQLNDAKLQAEQQLDDGQKQLNDAKEKLKDIPTPQWYILTRETNAGYVSFESNTDKVESIAKVFPLFFFLVAALVALTTMTRMVDEQRVQIGTMKALGYHKGRILLKYVLYAGVATIVGSAVGMAFGLTVFPTVIYQAYAIMYKLPPIQLCCDWLLIVITTLAALACTMLATLWAGYSSLWECPARLMLPRAPKIGKRILLEYIKPLWSHMSFTQKVTARNLFRYKKRFFMTVIGVAGCTALLLTGFGLQDAIHDIIDLQFGELWHYNVMVSVEKVDDSLQTLLQDKSKFAAYDEMSQKPCKVYKQAGGAYKEATFVVGRSMEGMSRFMELRDRQTKQPITLTENAVVLTEKMAQSLGVKAGDSVVIANESGQEATLTVSGVAENYVSSYVYMSQDLYKSSYGTQPETDSIAAVLADNTPESREALGKEILGVAGVHGISFTQDILDTFSNMMKSINYIVYVLIISAGALAFVVLYNLTNINITERQKEIATIKVLGFYNREVGMYIFREIILLSLIGTAVGLVLGIFLTRFVVLTAEVDMVMFGRSIKWHSFVLAAVLTMFFSGIVDLFMYRRLGRVDMVESMKAGE